MPNLASAKKALRQSKKRAERNQVIREEIHSLRRSFRKHVEAKDTKAAEAMLPELHKKLDKTVTKNVFKKNKVARIKSRLAGMIKRVGA